MILFRIRRIILSQPMFYHVMIYAFTVFVFEALRWLIVGLLGLQILPVYPSLLSFVINIIAFIPILFILKSLHRLMSGYR